MPDSQQLLTIFISAAVTAGLTLLVLRLLERMKTREAQSEAARVLQQAEKDAATKIREAELEIKERTLLEKAESEKELSAAREKICTSRNVL